MKSRDIQRVSAPAPQPAQDSTTHNRRGHLPVHDPLTVYHTGTRRTGAGTAGALGLDGWGEDQGQSEDNQVTHQSLLLRKSRPSRLSRGRVSVQ